MSMLSLTPARAVCLAVTMMGLVNAAAADGFFPGKLTPADQMRLQSFDRIRATAFAVAAKGRSAADLQMLGKVLGADPIVLTPAQLAGEWRCRIMRLGAQPPLDVNRFFQCRITDDAAGLRLEKVSGTDRLSGTFYDIGETRLGFAGALPAEGKPARYGTDEALDRVGYFVAISSDMAVLEMPLGGKKARLDVLELQR